MCKSRKKLLILFLIGCFLCVGGLMINGKSAFAENVGDLNVTLNIDGTKYRYKYPDVTYKSGFEDILIKNGKYDGKGRLKSIDRNFSACYEFKNLRAYLEKIAGRSDIIPIQANVEFDPVNARFRTTPEKNGRKLNIDKIVKDVEKSLENGKSYSAVIQSDIIYPEITEKSLKRSFNLRSRFSTGISDSTYERKNNIGLSLRQFNGLVIKPGEVVSFNEIVGPRTSERGYLTAKIILDGEFVDGVGGGVCQTSTTLYNALLLSDLEIIEYKQHSLKVSYVQPSFDAMVSSFSDLKFKNNSKNYIYMRTICTDERAYAEIYGEKLDYRIERKSEITFTGKIMPEKKIVDKYGEYFDKVKYRDEVFVLQSSKPEIRSEGYLDYIKNGELVKRKKIRSDVYSSQTGTIVYGGLERPRHPPVKWPQYKRKRPSRYDYLGIQKNTETF